MAATSTLSFIIASLILGLSSIGLDNKVGAHALAKPAALFVIGDSYADTGNHNPSDPTLPPDPWKPPYGYTRPGKPTGRYSDGRVITDFYAPALHVRKPVPYRVMNMTRRPLNSRYGPGVNFAFGGSGAFPTYGPPSEFPTLGDQLNQLKDLISRRVVPRRLIERSQVLLVVAGNDYIAYQQQHSNATDINEFIAKVVGEMARILNVLQNMGFRRIAVTTIDPLGCLPQLIIGKNSTTCDPALNQWSSLHNSLLRSNISSLQTKHPNTDFIVLDLNSAFQIIIRDRESPLIPCCVGVTGHICGDVDENGGPLYTVCAFPDRAFFWDLVHLTDASWEAILQIVLST